MHEEHLSDKPVQEGFQEGQEPGKGPREAQELGQGNIDRRSIGIATS